MMSSSVSKLSRQLAQLSVARRTIPSATNVWASTAPSGTVSSTPSLIRPWAVQCQTFATNRKAIDAKNAKRMKVQAKKKKQAPKSAAAVEGEGGEASPDASTVEAADPNQPFLQHQEWVKFQQSISVDGFQTGQITTAQVLQKKTRGGKQARQRRELERLQQQQKSQSSAKFPAIRYSEEETQELLKLAFDTLPERAGKRGTRNLKRQARRWKLVREIRSKYKRNIANAHEVRMEKRHWKREQTKAVKEMAPDLRAADADYQEQVLRRWAATMSPAGKTDAAKETATAE